MFPLATLEPGHWFIVGTCSNCNAKTPLFQDLTEGKSKLVGTFVMRCPECDMVADLTPEHYFHPIPD